MEGLIPIASKLQDVLGALGQNTNLDLPQIVVIGGQSSGKSSVLESVVGRSFLPRGTGIVTRRPLVLQLFNTSGKRHPKNDATSSSTEPVEEWGEFLHQPGKRYTDFSQIRSEISRDTNRLCSGPNSKGVSSTPIHLKIYSPRVLSLTMVDLPGLTKVAVKDQPEDIEEQIYQINVQYGSNPNAILLAVTGANTDLASSDALKLARELDPRGERTIGVLTKLDLMDPGTDAGEILHNKVIPLRRGYVAVVNRGQRDIDADLSIQVGLRNEERYFRTHPVYSRDRSLVGKCGTMNLARNLNGILIHHIRECLPELKIRIGNMMGDVQSELDALGMPEGSGDEPGALGGKLLGLLSKFSSNFAAMIDGRANELYGGARISFIFHQVFARSLNSVGAFDGLSEDEIRTTIGNANGTRPALFVPEISFDILVRRQIRRLEQPGVQCVDFVYDELQRIAAQSEPTELTRYPNLRDRMMDVVGALLKRSVGPTQMWVSNLVRIELSYINTNHPDFIGGSRAVARLMEKMANEKEMAAKNAMNAANSVSMHSNHPHHGTNKEGGTAMTPVREPIVQLPQVPDTMRQTDAPPSDRERVETEIIKSLIDSYFSIVRKNYIDMVPKTIMYFLVNHVKDEMQNELVSELYREAEVGFLMKEAEDIAMRRKTCVEMRDLLEKALEIVNEVRDFNTYGG
ncbi:dynamin GTPase, switch/motor protein [Thalassiosira pseudonana CCMP1335]|uniref:Dynamin GTPase, switch/motor protein n=1 Tax=Thalassiosira pseudonana TaxID=35128 RepID=B5YMC0_THAPS|nr:dynamin GTPase, switch/motor protein [Thalassiosira pseudonana CCMP1335]ACI64781.1 dynamin GTPase, switch/motor protein [Thalassiosira pseudonana CCMP1335]